MSEPYVSPSFFRKVRFGTRIWSLPSTRDSRRVGRNQVAKLWGFTRRSMCWRIFSHALTTATVPVPGINFLTVVRREFPFQIAPLVWKCCGNSVYLRNRMHPAGKSGSEFLFRMGYLNLPSGDSPRNAPKPCREKIPIHFRLRINLDESCPMKVDCR